MTNSIKEIKSAQGTILTEEEEIKREASDFFEKVLNHSPMEYHGMSVEDLRNLIPFRCSEEESHSLTREVTNEDPQCLVFHAKE